MLLKIYNSKRDINGNIYYYLELSKLGTLVSSGTICADNVSTYDCRENLGWEVSRLEISIREFKHLSQNAPYLGCTWEDIKRNLLKDIS